MIKLSYTYATPETASQKILAFRGPMEKTFNKLKTLGYEGVELMVRDVRQLDLAEIEKTLANTGLRLCAVSTGQLRAEDGLSLSALDSTNRNASVERTKDIISFAAYFKVQVNIGTLRGQMHDDKQLGKLYAKESISRLLDHALPLGVDIALEPQNRYTINWLNNVHEALNFCEEFTQPNLKLVFDVYHWLLEEPSIYASLIKAWDRITHIQFSDSNRSIPGTGHINFPDLLRVLNALRYNGFVSIEALQKPSSEDVAESSANYLLPLINQMPIG